MDILIPLFTIIVGTVIVGVSLGALACYLIYRGRIRASEYYASLPQVIDNIDYGFYWRNTPSGKEVFSEQLCQMLKLGGDERSFSALMGKLDETQSESIRQAITRFEQDKSSTIIIMSIGGERQFECRIGGTHDTEGKAAYLVLWLRDITEPQKIHEQLLKENRQLKREVKQFSGILNSLPTPIWLRNKDFAIRYCNMAYSMAAEEGVDHKEAQETLELHPLSRKLAAMVLEAGEEKSERRHIVIEGARKFYQFTEIPLKSENMTVGIAQDMTELENAKEELQRHVSAQSELLEGSTSAMAVFGADTRLKFFNHAYVRLWGLDEAWLSASPTYGELLELLREMRRLPEQANFLQFKQQRLKAFTGLIESQEEIFYLPDGRTLRVLAIPHAHGGILFAYEDVTDRLALERSYNTLIAVQRATLDNLHEGVVVFGENGRLRLYNPRFLQLWKLEKAVLSPETHISDLVDKTRPMHFSEEWDKYKQQLIAYLLARQMQHKRIERTDGTLIDSVVVPLPDGSNLITFYDVTDSQLVERSLRERNEALSEADRLKTEFLANVSYELRSPLTSIGGFSEMLLQNYFGTLNKKQQEYVAGIHEATLRLTSVISDILDIASIEAGYMKLSIAEFDIHAMLQSVVSLVSERLRENNLQLTLNCPGNIGSMKADETRIKQIIFNLLSNAIKYSTPNGMVMLSANTGKTLEEIIFEIEDNGIGIATEHQKDLFNKFHKGSGGGGSHKSGAGLGLSMVKSFIELHGGRVELFSAQGKGTKVFCYLPRVTVENAALESAA